MKEFWVNVYKIGGRISYGHFRSSITRFENWIGVYPIYRLHIRMKDNGLQERSS